MYVFHITSERLINRTLLLAFLFMMGIALGLLWNFVETDQAVQNQMNSLEATIDSR